MWPMKTPAITRKEHGCLAAALVPESSLLCVWLGSLTDPPASDSLFECPQHCDAPGPWWAIVSDSSWAMNCPSSALWQQPYLSFRAQCMWVVGWGREVLPGMIAYPDIHPLRVHGLRETPSHSPFLGVALIPLSHVNSQATGKAGGCSKLEITGQNHLWD